MVALLIHGRSSESGAERLAHSPGTSAICAFLLILLALGAFSEAGAFGTIGVWTSKSVYNVGETVQVSFETGGYGASGTATIDIYGPASYSFGPYDVATGTVYTATLTGITPLIGTYNVKVTLGLMYDVYEGYTSYQVVQARPGFDFSLSISPTSLTVKQGETARYTLSVKYSDAYYENTKITITSVAPLGAGMDWDIEPGNTLAITTSESSPAETYAFTVTGKAEGITRTTTATLTLEALKPVLTYVSVTGIPPTGGSLYVGEKSTSVVVISNTGNVKAQSVKVALEDLSPAGLVVTNADPVKDIEPLGTQQWMIEVQANRPGKYTGMLRTYVGSERILEQPWELTVSAPEIAIADKDTSSSGGQIFLGDTMTVTYTLKNSSPVDATEITVDVEVSDGLTILDKTVLTDVGSQSEVKFIIKLRADKIGNGWVRTTIKSYGTVVQEDETAITVAELPIWQQTWFLAAVGIGVAAAVGLIVMLRRRRGAPAALMMPQMTVPSEPSSSAVCPNCGKTLTYVQTHSRWYCTKCKEYV